MKLKLKLPPRPRPQVQTPRGLLSFCLIPSLTRGRAADRVNQREQGEMQGNTMAAPLPPSERLKLSRPVMASVGGNVEQVDRPSVYCRWEHRGRKKLMVYVSTYGVCQPLSRV